ncbi:TOG array regulator of axonemal microtubules protein 1-like isoform X3 [Scophthalmus maximus]|uniref:TOG array regulator of axonemal microtubules protein 1-like isoform X3 n=1 Tax=Scophthalmus maximus TaxID=52904 RepID=UPI0015E08DB2|nr:TOG array regulator of axonemal microtubules protein 1-like isoform X3 [Scophthalmus maximus]
MSVPVQHLSERSTSFYLWTISVFLLETMEYPDSSDTFYSYRSGDGVYVRSQPTRSQCRQGNGEGFTRESRNLDKKRAEAEKRDASIEPAERLDNSKRAKDESFMRRMGLSFHRILEIKKAQVEKRDAFIGHPVRLDNSQRTSNKSVLRRLGHGDNLPMPQPSALYRGGKSFLRGQRSWDKDPFARACKEDLDRDSPTASMGSLSSLSTVDFCTPDILREIDQIQFSLPAKPNDKDEEVVRSRLQTAKHKIEAIVEGIHVNSQPTGKFPPVTPLAPIRSKDPQTNRRGPQTRSIQHPARTVVRKGKTTASDGIPSTDTEEKVDAISETLERIRVNSQPAPSPALATKKIPVVTPLAPPRSKDPQTNRRGPQTRSFQHPARAVVRAGKKTASDGIPSTDTEEKVEAITETLERVRVKSQPAPSPTLATKKIPVVTPLALIHSKDTQTNRRGPQTRSVQHPARTVVRAGKTTASDGIPLSDTEEKPLDKPVASLSLCFQLLSLNDWKKKMDGMKIIRALAQHHSQTLIPKLRKVCLVLVEEVTNLRSAVACAAINTLAELYVRLQRVMDPEVEITGKALLLTLAHTLNAFTQQQINQALDAMVQNCSPGRVVNALFTTGLSHCCVAVKVSTAQHLHQLADRLGAAHVFRAGKTYTERFLIAVSKQSLDAAPEAPRTNDPPRTGAPQRLS